MIRWYRIGRVLTGILFLGFIHCQSSVKPIEKPVVEDTILIPELVEIKENLTFTMGCLPEWSCLSCFGESPCFKVVLSPYSIGKYEVRNDEYHCFVKSGGYLDSTLWSEAGWDYIRKQNRSCPEGWTEGDEPWINCKYSFTSDRPISNISWYEAEAYCNWLSRKTGEHYSIPTEAQWERAARGPDPGRIFPWGNQNDTTRLNNMYFSGKLYPVGSFPNGQSYEGCYDMCGNLWEYCFDWYDLEIYSVYKLQEPVVDPIGPDTSRYSSKSVRGCPDGVQYAPVVYTQIRTYLRMFCSPSQCMTILGFRIVKKK